VSDDTTRITVTLQTADPDNPDAVAWRKASKLAPKFPSSDEARTVDEWLLTGDPGHGYPPYRFTFNSDRYEDPERAARKFCELAKDWTDGPHLKRRTVTYTAWQEA
jgi:hypothetical protein